MFFLLCLFSLYFYWLGNTTHRSRLPTNSQIKYCFLETGNTSLAIPRTPLLTILLSLPDIRKLMQLLLNIIKHCLHVWLLRHSHLSQGKSETIICLQSAKTCYPRTSPLLTPAPRHSRYCDCAGIKLNVDLTPLSVLSRLDGWLQPPLSTWDHISWELGPVHTIGKASILTPFLTDFITVMETIFQVEVLRVRVKIFIQK